MLTRLLYLIFIGIGSYGFGQAAEELEIVPFWHGWAFGLIACCLAAILSEVME